MYIRVDTSSGVPLWQQIVGQVTRQAGSGRLAVGERLPTVRELAGELRINPNTVARAYQELERAQVVETKRGLGTFVRDGAHRIAPANLADLFDRVDALLAEAIQHAVGRGELLILLDERMAAMGQLWPTAKQPEELVKERI